MSVIVYIIEFYCIVMKLDSVYPKVGIMHKKLGIIVQNTNFICETINYNGVHIMVMVF